MGEVGDSGGGLIDSIKRLTSSPGLFGLGGSNRGAVRGLDNQVANLRAGVTPQNSPSYRPPVDPMQALQDQLFSQINSLPSYQTPIEQLRKMAQSQINAQFDPLIAALVSQQGQTQQRSERNQKDAKGMYNALAESLKADIPAMTERSRQEEAATTQRYDQAQSEMDADYAKNSQQQQALLKQLGIQAAAPDANSQQIADQAYFKGQNQLQEQSALDALNQMSQADTSYQADIANSSRLAGNNAVMDLKQQLEDYLAQSNGQLDALNAQKTSGLESLLAQMQGQDAQEAEKRRQAEIDNLMALANFQLSAQKAMGKLPGGLGGSGGASSFQGTSGPEGVSNFLAEKYGPDRSNTAAQIQELVNQTMANPDVVAGRHIVGKDLSGNDKYETNTSQYLMQILRQQMESEGWNSDYDLNNAVSALLAMQGKLR